MIQRINSLKLLLNSTCIPKLNISTVKYVTTHNSGTENWTEIYRLPLIRLVSAFNRLKVYQCAITLTGTPIVFALEQAGHLGPNYGMIFGALGFTGILTLTICSFPVRNLVGFIYMNDKDDRIKLAYVDFWGRRKDQVLVVDDITAPWELPESKINVYQPIRSRSDASHSYKLLNRYGVIRDPQRYASLFGEENY